MAAIRQLPHFLSLITKHNPATHFGFKDIVAFRYLISFDNFS